MSSPMPDDVRARMTDRIPDELPADLPDWLRPMAEGSRQIEGLELTQFLPPEGADLRRGAVLMLFGESADGGDVLLTERAHHMRSHPGQVSFPGGTIDPGETAVGAALRETWEEIGVDPGTVEVFGALPELWLPPSNFAVTPILGWWRDPGPVEVSSPDEVHEIHRVHLRELLDPEHRIAVRHPGGWMGPGFLIGEDKDVILWGFTGGILTRFFSFLGWLPPVEDPPMHDLPEYMLAEHVRRTSRTGDDDQAGDDGMDLLEPNE